ncbi:MAG: AAA family ATPase [Enhygromyxa sp.]
MPGSTIAALGYVLLETLHRSERVLVARARRREDGALRVLKSAIPGGIGGAASWRIRHEYRMLARFDDEGVVRAHALHETALGPVLELDSLAGVDLSSQTGRPMSLDRLLPIALSLARTLARIHDAGVVHRDLCASNIVLVGARPVLLDFGHATHLTGERPTQADGLHAVSAYQSPEQTARTNRSVDWRTDLYSFGVQLFELLTGQVPWPSADPLELVHAIVAQQPPAIDALVNGVPASLARLVAKLLRKAPEDRYQSAESLAADLERCAREWAAGGRISDFELARDDHASRFVFPARLYGRDELLASLRRSLDEVRVDPGARLIGVSGPAGIGKSAVIHELLRPLASRGGLVTSGKFERLGSPQPLVHLLGAAERLVDTVLVQSPAKIEGARARLEQTIGERLPLLCEALPKLALVVGARSRPRPVGSQEARRQLHEGLAALFRGFSRPGRPLLVFFDDVQWADAASLAVIGQMLESWPRLPLLVVLAWRGDEIDPGHPLRLMLERTPPAVTHELGELTLTSTTALVADLLHDSPESVDELATLVHTKTTGNPFYMRQLLELIYERGELPYDREARRRRWTGGAGTPLAVTDNVADLLLTRLAQLPSTEAISIGACLGNCFDLDLVTACSERDSAELAAELLEAIEVGLLELREGDGTMLASMALDAKGPPAARVGFGFPHDRVQEAAYQRRAPDQREATHLALARALQRRREGGDETVSLFDLVGQYNLGRARLETATQRRELAQLNFAAGSEARTLGAYEAALAYYEVGIELLDDQAWTTSYTLAFRLHLEAAHAVWMTAPAHAVPDYALIALTHASSILDRVEAQSARIRARVKQNQNQPVVHYTLEALAWLGVEMPEDPSLLRLARTFVRLRRKLRGVRTLEDLRGLPRSDDPGLIAAQKLMSRGSSAAYSVSQPLMLLFMLHSLELALDRGVSAYSSFGVAGYAFILSLLFKDPRAAEPFACFALELSDAVEGPDTRARIGVMAYGFVYAQLRSHRSIAARFMDLHVIGREGGDAEFSALAAFNAAMHTFLSGAPLDQTAELVAQMEAAALRLEAMKPVWYIRVIRQTVANLRGRAEDPARIDGEFLDREALFASIEASKDEAGRLGHPTCSGFLLVLLGEYDDALEMVAQAEAAASKAPGASELPLLLCYGGVARIEIARRDPGSRRSRRLLRRAKARLEQLRKLASTAPMNHAHKVQIVEGELASLAGQDRLALHHFDEAIALARSQGLHYDLICAALLAARSLLAARLGHAAMPYLSEARASILEWQAALLLPVVAELEAQVRALGVPRLGLNHPSGALGSDPLDELSVTRSAQAIASQVELTVLMRKLMEIVTRTAGAQRGLLLIERDQGLRLAVVARLEGREVETEIADLHDPPELDSRDPSAAAIVNYVARTNEPVVSDDASTDGRFEVRTPTSVMCLPVRRGTEQLGVIYLDNELSVGGFSPARLELVSVLASHAAVALKNALLYENLRSALDMQERLSAAYARFLPAHFLEQLGKHSVLSIELGDHAQFEYTVLFADIRGFTSMAERIGPAETFAFVNRYLHHVEPAIRKHKGFVYQIIGDGICALFRDADAAIHGGLALLIALGKFNRERAAEGHPATQVGIGVNTGILQIGAIGSAARLACGIVGDVANLASRVEGMTKLYGAPFLISGRTRARLANPAAYEMRLIDRVIPVGKTEALEIWEVLDGLPRSVLDARVRNAGRWAEAQAAWRSGELERARALFCAYLELVGDDPAASLFIGRCAERRGEPASSSWTGVTRLAVK